jgi:anti-sigma factor ChrR (cupin superfamily)
MTEAEGGSLPQMFMPNLDALVWQPLRDGVDVSWLYQNGPHGPAAAYLRYHAGARVPLHWHAGYEHVLVLQGSQIDHNGRHVAGSLTINPPGSAHEVVSEDGCLVLIIWERPVIFEPPPGTAS